MLNIVIPSPLFALFPSLTTLYALAPLALVLPLAFLQAQWTYTGYDASAHVSEETKQANVQAAKGIVRSIWVSLIAGFILLVVRPQR